MSDSTALRPAAERPITSGALFQLFGRVLIGSYFLAQSLGLISVDRSVEQAALSGDIPLALYWSNFGFQAVAALAIMIGFQAMIAAAVLSIHVLWTSYLLNYNPADAAAMAVFWKDLAMVGGLVLVIAAGRGTLGVDGMQRGEPARARPAPAPGRARSRQARSPAPTPAASAATPPAGDAEQRAETAQTRHTTTP